MKLCVPFKYWDAVLMCSGLNDVRYYLNGVHLNGNRIESTNGHVAYVAEFGDYTYGEGEGAIDGLSCQCGFVGHHQYNGKWPDIIIGEFGPKPSASIAKKSVWILIDIDGSEVTLRYINGSSVEIYIQRARVIDGRYPSIEKVIPTGEPPKEQFNVGFNPDYLALPKKILSKETGFPGVVKMTAYGENKAALFELERLGFSCIREILIIMPARLNES